MTKPLHSAAPAKWAAACLLFSILALCGACRQPDLSGSAEGAGPLLAVGTQAPDFTLPDSQGTSVTLSAFEGKSNVVLVFYPGDATPICTHQLCAIRDNWAAFQRANVTVFGVNPQSAALHRKFIQVQRYPFELLVDANKAVCTAYGTQAGSRTARTVYGIDREGTIVFAQRGEPTNKKILAAFGKK